MSTWNGHRWMRGAMAIAVVLAAWPAPATESRRGAVESVLFADDFERGLARWQIVGPPGIAIRDAGDGHGRVMELTPNGDVLALIRGSDAWDRVRIEGEMRFPSPVDNYLGFVYRHIERGGRRDFGVIYVKGNESYLQVNPHRDFNVSRTIYPELRVALTGPSTVVTGVWQRFALEVVGRDVHVYVGEARTPQLTFAGFEGERGAFGLQPRSVGGPVWVDNLAVRRIDALSYTGAPLPNPDYAPGRLLTAWRVAGPFDRSHDEAARRPETASWRPVSTDWRGGVVTGQIVDYHGPNTVAYWRTTIDAPAADASAMLELGTADDVAVWLNGAFQAFLARQDAAWFDVGRIPNHAGRKVPMELRRGRNEIIVRVRGGVYASGGFFARLVPGS